MKKNYTILALLLVLCISLACNPKIIELSKDLIPKLFPVNINFAQELNRKPVEIRRTTSGQFLINDEEGQVQQIILLTSNERDGEDVDGAFIIDPDVDTAIGVTTPNTSGLDNLVPNTLISAILKINDSTFLNADLVIKNPIVNLSDQTMITTGLSKRELITGSSTDYRLVNGTNDNYSHLKTQLIYQQDSVNLFLRHSLLTVQE
jgi:hypothetical protein